MQAAIFTAALLAVPASAHAGSITGFSLDPAVPAVGQLFNITVNGIADTDSQVVYLTIKRTGGAGCSTRPSLDQGQGISIGDPRLPGQFSLTTAPQTEDQSGAYLLCAYLQPTFGQDQTPVAQGQIIFQVVAPPTPAPTPAPAPVPTPQPRPAPPSCNAQRQAVNAAGATLARDRAAARKHSTKARRRAVSRDKMNLSRTQASLRRCAG